VASLLTSILRSACGWVLAAAATLAGAQQITIVSVTANGFGKTEAEAMTSAVINGVAQVNGEAIASSMRVKSTSTSSDAGTSGERTIEKDIARRTQGVVKSWRKIFSGTRQRRGLLGFGFGQRRGAQSLRATQTDEAGGGAFAQR